MAITPTVVCNSQLAGKRIWVATATITAASDTITLDLATYGVRTIYSVWGVIESGMDADFTSLQISFSGLVITIVAKQADGAAADEFTGTTVRINAIVD